MLDERMEPSDHSARERFLMLRSFPDLSFADDDGISYLASQTRLRRVERGTVLSEAGEPAAGSWIVRSGAVEVARRGVVCAVARRPEGAGFIDVVSGDARGVRAVATEPSVVLELGAASLLRGLEENFSLLRNALAALATGLLAIRGNLPADPDAPGEAELGTFRRRPLTLVERVLETRAASPVFQALDVAANLDLAAREKEIRHPPGTRLWSVGDPPGGSMRIVAGHVRCSEAGGRSVRVGAGFRLGGLDQMAGHPRVYDAVTETEVQADVTDGEAFYASLQLHRRAGVMLAAGLASQIINEQVRQAERAAAGGAP